MGRTSIVVNVGAVRLGIDHVGFCAESVKNSLGNVPGASVGTVQRHLHSAEGIDTQRDQIPYGKQECNNCRIMQKYVDMVVNVIKENGYVAG